MATAADALLEQFVEQGKSVSGRAAAELIEQATSAPGLFAFGELLDLDSVKQVRGGRKNKKPLPCFPLPFSNQNPSIPPKDRAPQGGRGGDLRGALLLHPRPLAPPFELRI